MSDTEETALADSNFVANGESEFGGEFITGSTTRRWHCDDDSRTSTLLNTS